jgi:hypothetical protein
MSARKHCSIRNHISSCHRLLLLLLCAAPIPPLVFASSHPGLRAPQLRAGQKFAYRVHYQTDKATRSESRIVTPLVPQRETTDTECLLTVEITGVQGAGTSRLVLLHTQVLPADGSARPKGDDGFVDFALQPDGQASKIVGLSALSPNEQSLWRQWVSQFAQSWTFPAEGVKPGEKWKKDEPVLGAPLAKLQWDKQFEYVRDQVCPQNGETGKTAKSPGKCAAIVTTTTMKQHGSHDDATPDDYKSAQLKTSGTAAGKTQLVTYISLQTGLVERATEDSAQTMDVLIAKADDSNKAHFNVDATSHTEIILMP